MHAAMVGSLHPTPVATLPFLSPHSAVVAFCEGILKHGTAWEALREDLAAKEAAMTLEQVRERMRNVLSLTDVTRFPIPKNPNAIIFVAATVSTISLSDKKDVLKNIDKELVVFSSSFVCMLSTLSYGNEASLQINIFIFCFILSFFSTACNNHGLTVWF